MEWLFVTEINYSDTSVSTEPLLPSHKCGEGREERIFLGQRAIPWLLGSWRLQLNGRRQFFGLSMSSGSSSPTPKSSTHFIAWLQLYFPYLCAGIAKLVIKKKSTKQQRIEQPAGAMFPPCCSSPFTTIHSLLRYCSKGRSQESEQICPPLSCREEVQGACRALPLTSHKILGKFPLPWCYPALIEQHLLPLASIPWPDASQELCLEQLGSCAWSFWGWWP